MTWYTVVSFGSMDQGTAGGAYRDRSLAEARVARADARFQRTPALGGSVADCRIHGYATRRQARAGDIGDDVGRRGRVE